MHMMLVFTILHFTYYYYYLRDIDMHLVSMIVTAIHSEPSLTH